MDRSRDTQLVIETRLAGTVYAALDALVAAEKV
jgi:hypothetical protein